VPALRATSNRRVANIVTQPRRHEPNRAASASELSKPRSIVQAALEQAELNLSYTQIQAEVAGVGSGARSKSV